MIVPGLSADDRTTVEAFFLQGHLRILCATSTLAHGVNLPAHLVVIKGFHHLQIRKPRSTLGTNQWRGGTRGYEKMSKSTVLQMIGRAGRPGFDTTGTAVIMTSTEDRHTYSTLTLNVVESSLPGILVEGEKFAPIICNGM